MSDVRVSVACWESRHEWCDEYVKQDCHCACHVPAHNADAALREAVDALEKIAAPKTKRDDGNTICLRCGVETWHEKDGELQHELDCAQQIAAAALSALRSPATGEG